MHLYVKHALCLTLYAVLYWILISLEKSIGQARMQDNADEIVSPHRFEIYQYKTHTHTQHKYQEAKLAMFLYGNC